MVQGMVGGGIDVVTRGGGEHVAVVDEDAPDLDSEEEEEVEVSLEGDKGDGEASWYQS